MLNFSVYNKERNCFLYEIGAKIDTKGRLYLETRDDELNTYVVVRHTEINYTDSEDEIKEGDIVFTYSDLPGNEDRMMLGVVKYIDGAWYIENPILREGRLLYDDVSYTYYVGTSLEYPTRVENMMNSVDLFKMCCDLAKIPSDYTNDFISKYLTAEDC